MATYGTVIKHVLQGTDIQTALPSEKETAIVKLEGYGVNNAKSSLNLTYDMLVRGTLLAGETGSGKSYCLKKIIKELRKSLNTYSMIVVQTKNDFDDLVEDGDLILEQGIHSDQSVHWNLFFDILADGWDDKMIELNTRELVSHMFAEKKNQTKEQFFVDGAKELLYSVIITLIKKGKSSIRDRANLTNKGLMQYFKQFDAQTYKELLQFSSAPGVLKMIIGDGDEANLQQLGVYGELITTLLSTFIDIFAEEGCFSVRQFVSEKKGRALFVKYDPAYKDSQIAIFGSIIKLALKEALSQNATSGNVILVCDELPAMGKTDLAEAVNLGRAKGLITIAGIQSIAQLYYIYGEMGGRKLMAGLTNKLYFRPNDLLTRDYMLGDFGKIIAEYMVFSPYGTASERRKSNVLEDNDLIALRTGDCFAKLQTGEQYFFHIT